MSKNRKNRKRQKNQKYEEFIKFLFARGESDGGVWRWDDELKEPDLTKEEVVEFVHYMFDNYETDLSVYSDSQLGFGLEYIFYNCYSNYCFFLRDGPVSIEKRVKAILSLKVLYRKCLNLRCLPSLGYLSEEGNQLNNFCYGLWDSALPYCEESSQKKEIHAAVLEVMQYALSSTNIACIESGLHGLGHLAYYCEDAPKIVRGFIDGNSCADDRLIKYAKSAERGLVN
tara:strand:- start:623 stop:1306 length:684 start_codon:yes stop_codon:yes gene_type:complete